MGRIHAEEEKVKQLGAQRDTLKKDIAAIDGESAELESRRTLQEMEQTIALLSARVVRMREEDMRRGWKRIYNHDECPQMLCYGSGTGTTRRRVATVKGCRAIAGQMPNREGISIHAGANLDGDWLPLHLLECAGGINESMVNEGFSEADHILLSPTEHGVQTGVSLLAYYRRVDRWLEETEFDSEFSPFKVGMFVLSLCLLV